jgi:hypothetical protein
MSYFNMYFVSQFFLLATPNNSASIVAPSSPSTSRISPTSVNRSVSHEHGGVRLPPIAVARQTARPVTGQSNRVQPRSNTGDVCLPDITPGNRGCQRYVSRPQTTESGNEFSGQTGVRHPSSNESNAQTGDNFPSSNASNAQTGDSHPSTNESNAQTGDSLP